MTANTKIEWADHTFNPWIGCTKVGPGCDHCYAEADFDKRRHVVTWGAGQPRKRTAPSTWAQPLRWNKEAERLGIRYRVFCASLADVFDNEVPPLWRQHLMSMIARTPNLDWLLLTKRIGNAARMLSEASMHDGLLLAANDAYRPPANLWIGATIVNQEEADRDIVKLLAVPAAKHFLSMEPLLGPVDLRNLPCGEGEIDALKPDTWEEEIERWRDTDADWIEQFEDWYSVTLSDCSGPIHSGIDWVIVGGESGPNARPMHPNWVRGLRRQCKKAGVPFMFKQWGEWRPMQIDEVPKHGGMNVRLVSDGSMPPAGDGCYHMAHQIESMVIAPAYSWQAPVLKLGKKAAGRLLDGRTWDGVPT